MGKKIIRLTEQDIHNLIMESLDSIIKNGYTEPLSMEKQLLHIENVTRLLNEKEYSNTNVVIKGDTLGGQGTCEMNLEDIPNNMNYYLSIMCSGQQSSPRVPSTSYYSEDEYPTYKFQIEEVEITCEDLQNEETIEMTLSHDENMPQEVMDLFNALEQTISPEYDLEEYNPY